MAIGLTAIAVMAILRPTGPQVGWIGLAPIVIVIGWLSLVGSTRRSPTPAVPAGATSHAESLLAAAETRHGNSTIAAPGASAPAVEGSLRRDILIVVIAAIIILTAAPFLVIAAEVDHGVRTRGDVRGRLVLGPRHLPARARHGLRRRQDRRLRPGRRRAPRQQRLQHGRHPGGQPAYTSGPILSAVESPPRPSWVWLPSSSCPS